MSFILKLNHLGHTELKALDESFHALVARNLLHHPLDPTLIERPLLSSDESNWMASHVWLHKPPMALWQIAGSFFCFGVNAFALRLPSALLSTAAAWVTYRIGARLIDPLAGAIAAGLQAFNPALLMLVHGYLFSDHVDTSLLFWTELGMLMIVCCAQAKAAKTARSFAIVAGIAGGFAFLTKSYLGLIVPGVAVGTWMLWRICGWSTPMRFRGKHVAIVALATAATACPYLIYAETQSPHEFFDSYLAMLKHVQEGVEGYGAPWDRLWFDYAADAFYVFYVTALAGAVVLAIRAIQNRDGRLAFLFLWAGGVFATMTLTTNKTPSATVIGWPPVFIFIGGMISRGWNGDRAAAGASLAAMIAAVIYPGHYLSGQMGTPAGAEFGAIARTQMWIGWELGAALCGAVIAAYVVRDRQRLFVMIAIVLVGWLAVAPRLAGRPGGYLNAAYRVTEQDRETPELVRMGAFAQTLPKKRLPDSRRTKQARANRADVLRRPHGVRIRSEHRRLENAGPSTDRCGRRAVRRHVANAPAIESVHSNIRKSIHVRGKSTFNSRRLTAAGFASSTPAPQSIAVRTNSDTSRTSAAILRVFPDRRSARDPSRRSCRH